MDVRCERCRTEYEFDDEKITEAGVTVRCTVCGHVFKVKKKALVVTEPFKPGEEPRPPAPDLPPAAPDKPREWRVRQASGNVFTFKELTTLQKWIVERKVARDDEISLTGESWKRLGNIAELASFFQVVEAADRANALETLAQQQGLAPQQQSLAPPPPTSSSSPAARQAAPSAAWEGELAPVEPVAAREPAWSGKGGELDANELAAIKGSGKGKFVAAALLLLAVAAGGLWFARRPSAPAAEAPADAVASGKEQPIPTAPAEPPAAAVVQAPVDADAGPAAAIEADADAGPAPVAQALPDAGEAHAPSEPAAQVAADADAGAPVAQVSVDAGAPAAQQAAAAAVPAVAAAPAAEPKPSKASGAIPDGKDFYWYIERALAQRERGNVAQALALYEKAEKLEPNSFEVNSGKGFCQLDKGNHDAAIALFQKALAKNPRFLDAIFGLAEGYKEKGDKAKAVEYYRKYLDSAPDGPEANLAKVTIERLSRE